MPMPFQSRQKRRMRSHFYRLRIFFQIKTNGNQNHAVLLNAFGTRNFMIAALLPARQQFLFAHAVNLAVSLLRNILKPILHNIFGNICLTKIANNRHTLKLNKIGKETYPHRSYRQTAVVLLNISHNMRRAKIISVKLLAFRNSLFFHKDLFSDGHRPFI